MLSFCRMTSLLCISVVVSLVCFVQAQEDLLIRLKHQDSHFILNKPEVSIKTEYGDIQVLLSPDVLKQHSVGLGFITLQPRTLLLPHYIDSSFIIFVKEGSAKIGWISEGEILHQNLNVGDVYAIPAGALFYILSTDEERDLKIYGMYDMQEALESGVVKAFYVSGESNLFSGFDIDTLAAAFKVSAEGVVEFFNAQSKRAIVPASMETFAKLSNSENWGWKTITNSINKKKSDVLNLFSKKRLFENQNGWFSSTCGTKLPVLKKSRVGVLAANLKPGSLLAPHWNPEASVIGIVTNGSGSIQMAYPNGTNALNTRLEQGSIFFVPRYFPVCEIASRNSSLEFIGFTASDKYRKHGHPPQFLTGTNSVLREVDLETLSLSFNMPEMLLTSVLEAQQDEIVLSGVDA